MALYKDIIETVRMIEKENLDIRTTTMGISLFVASSFYYFRNFLSIKTLHYF